VLAEQRLVAAGLELGAKPRRDLVQVVVDPFQRAVLVEQGDGRLLADAADPGDVVAGISDERLVVDDLKRFDPELLPDFLGAVVNRFGQLLPGQADRDAICGKLQQIAIAGQDRHLDALYRGALGNRPQDVVGLEAFASGSGSRGGHQLRIRLS
jgi:hypothetical protein